MWLQPGCTGCSLLTTSEPASDRPTYLPTSLYRTHAHTDARTRTHAHIHMHTCSTDAAYHMYSWTSEQDSRSEETLQPRVCAHSCAARICSVRALAICYTLQPYSTRVCMQGTYRVQARYVYSMCMVHMSTACLAPFRLLCELRTLVPEQHSLLESQLAATPAVDKPWTRGVDAGHVRCTCGAHAVHMRCTCMARPSTEDDAPEAST